MSSEEIKKKSIIEVFNAMDFCDKSSTCKLQNSGDAFKSGELSHITKPTTESKSFKNAVDAAIKAQNKWQNSTALKRANSLHKIWKNLRDILVSFPDSDHEIIPLMYYFDFYADMAIHTEDENLRPYGVILIALPSDKSPFFMLCATVPAALAAGCSVIVLIPEEVKIISLFLEEILLQAGLPEGLYNTVAEFTEATLPYSEKISKVVFCGSYTSAMKFCTRYPTIPFDFFCPGNTAALILESADLDAAADEMVTEGCTRNTMFAISNVVIQESVSKFFLEKFKYRLRQFLSTNKNSKFKYAPTEKVSKSTAEASCAFVERYDFDNEISVTINYQNQDIDEEEQIIKILICRTAREGVGLLNNCRYSLGTSIWTEISSQALEISSRLTCPNIWINTHGVFNASIPLQLLGFSGNCVLGGSEGIFEYLSLKPEYKTEVLKSDENENADTKKLNITKIALSAQSAFNAWQNCANRREYLKDLAESLEASNELSKLSETISWFGHFGNLATSFQRNAQGYFILWRKIPVGVFLLAVNTTNIDIKSFATLITALIAFGNTVIVTLKEVNSTINSLIKNFTRILPKNVVRVIVGIENAICLASDPNVQAVWIYDESPVSTEFLVKIKGCSATRLKHMWIIPKAVPVSQRFFEKECLKSQVVWLTDADQFP